MLQPTTGIDFPTAIWILSPILTSPQTVHKPLTF
jgi:hypothetical protein